MPTKDNKKNKNNSADSMPEETQASRLEAIHAAAKEQQAKNLSETPEIQHVQLPHVRSPEEVLKKEATLLIAGIRKDMTAEPPKPPRPKKK